MSMITLPTLICDYVVIALIINFISRYVAYVVMLITIGECHVPRTREKN